MEWVVTTAPWLMISGLQLEPRGMQIFEYTLTEFLEVKDEKLT